MAKKYDMMNGQSLFIGRSTQRKLDSNGFFTGKAVVDHREYPINFECFGGPKAVENVTQWMYNSTSATNLPKEYFGRMLANDGSNATGSIQEFEVVGQEEDEGRIKNTDFNVCFSHQNEQSGGYASGADNVTSLPNEPLGEVLKNTIPFSKGSTGTQGVSIFTAKFRRARSGNHQLIPTP